MSERVVVTSKGAEVYHRYKYATWISTVRTPCGLWCYGDDFFVDAPGDRRPCKRCYPEAKEGDDE